MSLSDPSFRFRQFQVSHHRSTMKVGTDAVVLGAWVKLSATDESVLDIGCGSGIIALMLAQRSNLYIDAIDIDSDSVEEASQNFSDSPWSTRLRAVHTSLAGFAADTDKTYDLVVSNPPFFQNSMLSANEKLSLAKHNVQLSLDDFLGDSVRLMKATGRLCVILPVQESRVVLMNAERYGLFLHQKLTIIPKEGKPANRMILEMSKQDRAEVYFERIVLRDSSGNFSEEYKKLTRDFHPSEYF